MSPYDYKKLSLSDREEILRYRRENGYPLHSPPHLIRGSGSYLITSATYKHATILNSPDRLSNFETLLLKAFQRISAEVICWVVLPNHYHILVQVEEFNVISSAVKQLHGTTAREWNQQDHQTGQRRVWYKFFDLFIRDSNHHERAFNYVHYNPVKHGLVTDVYEWPWSSLNQYYDDFGKDWLREKWQSHPPTGLGKGWDDIDPVL